MKKVWLLILFYLFPCIHTFAQKIQIKSVNESEYPLIKVAIESTDLKNLDFNSLFIIENKDSTTFSVDSIPDLKKEKAICFLIDEDLVVETTRNDIVDAIIDITKKMQDGDFVNVILSTEKKTKDKCIYPLSFEFSNKPESFIEFLDIYFTSANYAVSPKNMDCSIDQTLEFIHSKKYLPAIRLLIIISKIPYAGGQDWQSLQKKASDYGIQFQWFSFTTKTEFYSTYNSNIQDIISDHIDSLNSGKNVLTGINKSYILNFYTKQKDKLNQFEIDYKGIKIRSTFERSSYISFFKDNSIILIILAVFVLLILFFIANLLYTRRQMALSLKELRESKQYTSKIIDTAIIENFDSSKTQYGSSIVVPYLTIEIGGITFNYELKKLLTKIGRQKENDLVIEDFTISSHHATITKEGGNFYLQDNESTNGTFVNEIRINKSVIKNGDSVRMGKALLSITY